MFTLLSFHPSPLWEEWKELFESYVFMTHGQTLIPAMLLTLSLLTACRSDKNTNDSATADEPQKEEVEQSAEDSRKIVRKALSVPSDFTYIMNIGDVDIIYTQGECSMEVVGDSNLIKFLNTDFDSNLLTISLKTDANQKINRFSRAQNVQVYLSSPTLECVSVCGAGNFTYTGDWKSDKIQIGVFGKGNATLGNLECNSFVLQSTEDGDVAIAHLKATDATFTISGRGVYNVDVDVENLYVLNDVTKSITFTGKATTKYVSHPKEKNLHDNVICPM